MSARKPAPKNTESGASPVPETIPPSSAPGDATPQASAPDSAILDLADFLGTVKLPDTQLSGNDLIALAAAVAPSMAKPSYAPISGYYTDPVTAHTVYVSARMAEAVLRAHGVSVSS